MVNSSERPACTCRECGGEMEEFFQPGLLPGRDGHFFVTCWQPGCPLNGYTLNRQGYGDLDLSDYLKVEQAS